MRITRPSPVRSGRMWRLWVPLALTLALTARPKVPGTERATILTAIA